MQMTEDETKKFEELLVKDIVQRQKTAEEIDKKIRSADEYDTMQLYGARAPPDWRRL